MGLPIKGKEITGSNYEWYRFEEKGQWLIGAYYRSEDTDWNCKRHLLALIDSDKGIKGEFRWILGNTILDKILPNLKPYEIIGIEYQGEKRSNSSKRKYKHFIVSKYTDDIIKKHYGEEILNKVKNTDEHPF